MSSTTLFMEATLAPATSHRRPFVGWNLSGFTEGTGRSCSGRDLNREFWRNPARTTFKSALLSWRWKPFFRNIPAFIA